MVITIIFAMVSIRYARLYCVSHATNIGVAVYVTMLEMGNYCRTNRKLFRTQTLDDERLRLAKMCIKWRRMTKKEGVVGPSPALTPSPPPPHIINATIPIRFWSSSNMRLIFFSLAKRDTLHHWPNIYCFIALADYFHHSLLFQSLFLPSAHCFFRCPFYDPIRWLSDRMYVLYVDEKKSSIVLIRLPNLVPLYANFHVHIIPTARTFQNVYSTSLLCVRICWYRTLCFRT